MDELTSGSCRGQNETAPEATLLINERSPSAICPSNLATSVPWILPRTSRPEQQMEPPALGVSPSWRVPGQAPGGPPWPRGRRWAEGVGEPVLARGKAICPASTGPRPARGSGVQTAHQAQHTLRPMGLSRALPCPAGGQEQSACPQSMQGLSNSLATEYLRRKIPFFFPRKREKGREEEARKEGGGKEGGRNVPHHCSQGHRHRCGAGAGKEPLI